MVPFGEALEAAHQLELESGVQFLRVDPLDVAQSDYLDRQFVMTTRDSDLHDSWTDLYTSAEFYRWLLRQSSPVPSWQAGVR